jgi:hypothetical protein
VQRVIWCDRKNTPATGEASLTCHNLPDAHLLLLREPHVAHGLAGGAKLLCIIHALDLVAVAAREVTEVCARVQVQLPVRLVAKGLGETRGTGGGAENDGDDDEEEEEDDDDDDGGSPLLEYGCS